MFRFILPLALAATVGAQVRVTNERDLRIADVIVVPDAGSNEATMVYLDYIAPTVEFYRLGRTPNGYGNLPSDPIAVIYHDAGRNHVTSDPAPGSYIRSVYKDRNDVEHEVKTEVIGNNRKAALEEHKTSLAALMEAFPPAPKRST